MFMVETVLDDGVKTSETFEVPGSGDVVRFVWPKAKAVEVRSDGAWTQVASEMENWRRMVRHRFEKRKIDAVRITCFETWGDSSAQIFEVRVY